ncbi:MAG: hypothetical protein ACLFU2_08320 [Opitutales bacterium]
MNRFTAVAACLLAMGWLSGTSLHAFSAEVENLWPWTVRLEGDDAGRPGTLTAFGPLWETREGTDYDVRTLRPFYTEIERGGYGGTGRHILYPFFNHYEYPSNSHWHVLNLVRGSKGDYATSFEAWPFVFWRDRPGDEADTLALWPLGGRLSDFFGRKHVDFALWPLYIRTEGDGEVRYSTPWPFIQTLTGEASGFALWPLGGRFHRPGEYDRRFAFWPIFHDHREKLGAEVPYRSLGVLPFYLRQTGDGLRSETYLWPFFGYTKEWEPRPSYHERRYFWPFLVQGRGEEAHTNRWMPFYTYERTREREKWWYLWPIFKHQEVDLEFLTRKQTQVLYFLFRDRKQVQGDRILSHRQTMWPFYSYWTDGAGRTQMQALDPVTAFFPSNPEVRETWTPLFALYRYDRRGADKRLSILWNLIVHEDGGNGKERLTIGPLYRHEERADARSWSVLRGLVAREVENGQSRWSFLWQGAGETSP